MDENDFEVALQAFIAREKAKFSECFRIYCMPYHLDTFNHKNLRIEFRNYGGICNELYAIISESGYIYPGYLIKLGPSFHPRDSYGNILNGNYSKWDKHIKNSNFP